MYDYVGKLIIYFYPQSYNIVTDLVARQLQRSAEKNIRNQSKEKGIRVSRSIKDSHKIGLLARKCFEESYEVIVWEREKRIIKVRRFVCSQRSF